MKELFKFIADVHKSGNDTSAKRFYGGIGFLMSVITIISAEHSQLSNLLVVSAGLIGLGTVETIFKK